MTQFDVHRNPGRHTDTIPYVVVLHPFEMVSVPVDRLGPSNAPHFTRLEDPPGPPDIDPR